jgi:hypothetical protein
MTNITSRPRSLVPSYTRRERRSDAAARRAARRRRLVQRGVIASYLHDISARHTPTAPAV